jgi:cyclopropane fatty-acyl-phospholipid synthase-like methyltransferase
MSCTKYPLSVQVFKDSGLSSLTLEIDPNILYSTYYYRSSVSQPYIDHCKEMFNFVDHYLDLQENDSVLDIGGNDGTLLKSFLEKKNYLDVLNIDASTNLIEESIKNNINSINAFWNLDLAKKINKKFRLITTTNCFQHTLDINSFVNAISISLDKFGIWCLEFPYWKNTVETNQFDQVYHEHIYYYLIKPISILLEKYNLRIIKVTKHDIHGGTIRLLISHIGDLGQEWQPCHYSIPEILKLESNLTVDKYIEWGSSIEKTIKTCREYILNIKTKNKKIVGFGAAAKGCIFLNSQGLDYNHINYVIDDTDTKQNKFIPGTGIQILSRDILKQDNPDYILLLAHNFSEYIIKSLKYYGYIGKFIVLLPEIKEIE